MIPIKILSNNRKITSARGRWEEGKGGRFVSFPFPSSPCALSLVPLPSLPTTQWGICGGERGSPSLVPIRPGDFGCDVICQACRESSCYRTRFQASSGNSDSANWPGYEAGAVHLQSTKTLLKVNLWGDMSLPLCTSSKGKGDLNPILQHGVFHNG